MNIRSRGQQKGIALLTVLLFLLLLSALAVGLMYVSSTDTQVNANFRAEQSAYFAARAGLEELRDRMTTYNANTITVTPGLPAVAPTTANAASVIYMVNEGTNSGSVSPWASGNAYMDTELCHESVLGLTALPTDVPCASAPSSGSYTKITSKLPFNGTSATIPFKWARLTLKTANSLQAYPVETNGSTNSAIVCWNGTYEVALPTGKANCAAMNPGENPVYLITALAVTSTGGRKMVQAEVAQYPGSAFQYGLFATGTGCGAVSLGGGATTDSFNSSLGTYNQTKVSTGGDVGSNGNVQISGGSTIGGSVGSPITPSVVGACPGAPLSINGNSGGLVNLPGNQIDPINSIAIPTPTVPSTSGPDQRNPATLSAGNYGNITLTNHTTLVLNGGTYNINSISISGQATIVINNPVILNVQGTGQNTPIDLEGGSVTNNTGLAADMQINYAGTGTVKIAGGAATYLVVDAPNANVALVGNTAIYGAIVGNTISDQGGAAFHYDSSVKLPVPLATYYSMLGFRELYY